VAAAVALTKIKLIQVLMVRPQMPLAAAVAQNMAHRQVALAVTLALDMMGEIATSLLTGLVAVAVGPVPERMEMTRRLILGVVTVALVLRG
jgi:hypothetical protein